MPSPTQSREQVSLDKLLRIVRRFADYLGDARNPAGGGDSAPRANRHAPPSFRREEVPLRGAFAPEGQGEPFPLAAGLRPARSQQDKATLDAARRLVAAALPGPIASFEEVAYDTEPVPARRAADQPAPWSRAEREGVHPSAACGDGDAPATPGGRAVRSDSPSVDEVARAVTDRLDLECKRRTSLSLTEALQSVRDRLRRDGAM